jgi:hypothetical protein
MRISHEPLEQVASAIGRSCYWWSSIEIELQGLCASLARFNDRSFDREKVWEVLAISLSHMEIRQRVAVAKALAANGLDPDLYGEVESLLNHIDNDLRPERNRYVHDEWMMIDDSIVRRKHGAKVIRPQPRQLSVLKSTDRIYGYADDVDEFAQRVAKAVTDLLTINSDLDELYLEVWPPDGRDLPSEDD